MDDKEKIVLSNNGLKDLVGGVIVYNAHVDMQGRKFKLNLTLDASKINYLVESKDQEVRRYLNRLIEVADRNTIKDTDKVFFTKNSLFPRTAFNRYSTKARRIESIVKADKIVIEKPRVVSSYNNQMLKVTVTDKNNETRDIYINANFRGISNQFRFNASKEVVQELKSFINDNSNHYDPVKITDDMKAIIIKELKISEDISKVKCHLSILRYLTMATEKDAYTFEKLLSGKIPISKITTDKNVNKYIDKFRGVLDEGMYDYLLQSLSGSKSDKEVPMQLLSQLKIEDNDYRLKALFFNLNQEAIWSISGHKVLNSVDVKNFVKTQNLTKLIHRYDNPFHNITMMVDALEKLKDNKSRESFFNLIKDQYTRFISEILDVDKENIKIRYEDIKN